MSLNWLYDRLYSEKSLPLRPGPTSNNFVRKKVVKCLEQHLIVLRKN